MNGKDRLVLFDIDQTLISSAGAGVRALSAAFEKELGIPGAMTGIRCDGKLDPAIILEVLERKENGAAPALVSRILERYLECLRAEMEDLQGGHIKPGIKDVLDRLGEAGVRLGLLTGNVQRGARIKLERFALNSYFPVGAFGDDAEERWQLVPIARRRAEEHYGTAFAPGFTFVIGDSPRDIECCRPSGIVSIAVATGSSPPEVLSTFKPHYLFPDCSESRQVVRTILSHDRGENDTGPA